MNSMNHRLLSAETEEDFQAVGLLGREALISLAQAVYDPDAHPPLDGVVPSETDASECWKHLLPWRYRARVTKRDAGSLNRLFRWRIAFSIDVRANRNDAELTVAGVESAVRIMETLTGRVQALREPWCGVELQGRYFAWSGPALHSLEDRAPVPTPAGLTEALRGAKMTPSFGMRDRLNHHLAQGCHQLFETDRRTWRRELSYAGDGRQVLIVR